MTKKISFYGRSLITRRLIVSNLIEKAEEEIFHYPICMIKHNIGGIDFQLTWIDKGFTGGEAIYDFFWKNTDIGILCFDSSDLDLFTIRDYTREYFRKNDNSNIFLVVLVNEDDYSDTSLNDYIKTFEDLSQSFLVVDGNSETFENLNNAIVKLIKKDS